MASVLVIDFLPAGCNWAGCSAYHFCYLLAICRAHLCSAGKLRYPVRRRRFIAWFGCNHDISGIGSYVWSAMVIELPSCSCFGRTLVILANSSVITLFAGRSFVPAAVQYQKSPTVGVAARQVNARYGHWRVPLSARNICSSGRTYLHLRFRREGDWDFWLASVGG